MLNNNIVKTVLRSTKTTKNRFEDFWLILLMKLKKRTTIGGLLNTLKLVNLTLFVEISCLTARIGINKFNIDQFKFYTCQFRELNEKSYDSLPSVVLKYNE